RYMSLIAVLTAVIVLSIAAFVRSQTERLEILGNVEIFGQGNGLIFPDGTKLSSAAQMVGGGGVTPYVNIPQAKFAPMFGTASGLSTEADKLQPVARAGSMTHFRVSYERVTPGSTDTVKFTLRKNEQDTLITCSINNGTDTGCVDTDHTVPFAVGDLVSVKS